MGIKRPMKAPSEPIVNEELSRLKYPLYGSPKLDGFRCIVDGAPRTSSMKLFANPFVHEVLSDPIYHGLDGELVVGAPFGNDVFERTSGPLRRQYGQPDFKFYVFDYWKLGHLSYEDRWLDCCEFPISSRIVVLPQTELRSPEEVIEYEKQMLELGYEGAMIRSPDGRYKEGRCTFNEMNIFKRKPFVECEAEIIGFYEAMLNLNEQKVNEMGLSKRSSNKENLVPKGTCGALELLCNLWPTSFRCGFGEGFTDEMKQTIWNNREFYLNKKATVKYQKYGSRDAPRLPKITKIRPSWDIGD